jgi:predicted dithiol-disulfide oxidoreductase (DUF899 family)
MTKHRSSRSGDFNYDFNASYTEEQQRSGTIEYNYRKSGISSRTEGIAETQEAPEAGTKIAATVGRLGHVPVARPGATRA